MWIEYQKIRDEKNERYIYKDIPTLITETENNIYNLCSKVQAYTKEKYLHKEAVKSFCKKQKFILALKSLLFLKENHKNSEEYITSLSTFEFYLTANLEKTKENVTTTIKTHLEFVLNKESFNQEMNNLKASIENSEIFAFDKPVNMIKNFVYSSDIKSSDVEKLSFSSLEVDSLKLRKVTSEKSLFVEMFLRLFTNDETAKKFKVIFLVNFFLFFRIIYVQKLKSKI